VPTVAADPEVAAPGLTLLAGRGLATLGPTAVRLHRALDLRFARLASELGAEEMRFPPVIAVADLERIGYFRQFPAQGALVTHLARPGEAAPPGAAEVPPERLAPSPYVLTPAACYAVYLSLEDAVIEGCRALTAVSQCFRHQEPYRGLGRMFSFTQRKIVFVGSSAAVREGIAGARRRLLALAAAAELPLTVRPAEPDESGAREGREAQVARLFVQDEELVYGELVLAQTNFHRSSYTRPLNVRTRDGAVACAGCVGLNYEAWLEALGRRFDGDSAGIAAAVGADDDMAAERRSDGRAR
jgi:hypothetical protein